MAGTVRIAWRNLGRNRRRTLITGSALAIGICLSVATFGLTDGMLASMLESLTRLDVGHVQIHDPEFPRKRALRHTIPDAGARLAAVREDPAVVGAAPRVYGYALLSREAESLGAELVGVEPSKEPGVTVLDERVVRGRYLHPDPTPWPEGRTLTAEERALDESLTERAEQAALAEIEALTGEGDAAADSLYDRETSRELARALSPPPEHPPRVYVGVTLAKILDLEVGDELHATTQTVDGQSEQVFLEVGGIFRTGTAQFDRSRVYMHLADLQRFLHLHDRIHEIALVLDEPAAAPGLADQLDTRLDGDVLVRSWDEIRPELARMIDVSRAGTAVMVFIIFFVATLGVVNTMLMAVFERTRELGVLKAIGMSGTRIVGLIVAETLLLVLAASAVGTLLGLGLDLYLVHHGLDLRSFTEGFTIEGVGMSPVLYGAITPTGLILPTLILSATCFLASFYPAIRAARMKPAVGMRET